MTYKKMLILALVFATIAAFGTYRFFQKMTTTSTSKQVPMVTVVIAKANITQNKVILPEDIEIKKLMSGDQHQESFTSIKDVINKVAIKDITVGEQVIADSIASKGDSEKGLSFLLSDGKRAISVAVNEVTCVGMMLNPGDHVDILARLVKKEGQNQTVAINTILEDIKVLAIGKDMQKKVSESKDGDAKTITLEVYPLEAEKIFYGTEDAKLMFVLRPPGENATTHTVPVQLEDLWPYKAPAIDKPIPSAVAPSTVIRYNRAKK